MDAWVNHCPVSQDRISDYFDVDMHEVVFSFSGLFYKAINARASGGAGGQFEDDGSLEAAARRGESYFEENIKKIKLI